jgi:hypothetical protein
MEDREFMVFPLALHTTTKVPLCDPFQNQNSKKSPCSPQGPFQGYPTVLLESRLARASVKSETHSGAQQTQQDQPSKHQHG